MPVHGTRKHYQDIYTVFLKGYQEPIQVRTYRDEGWCSKDARFTGEEFLRFIADSWAPEYARTIGAHTVALV